MRSTLFISALVGLTAAMPYYNTPDTEATSMEIADWFDRRTVADSTATSCTSLPAAYGPNITPDIMANFRAYEGFFKPLPTQSSLRTTSERFQNYDGSTSASNHPTYYSLQKYDAATSTARCATVKDCVVFKLYFERDPCASTDTRCCPNLRILTDTKCGFGGVMRRVYKR